MLKIIEDICHDVIFLEEFEDNYSNYDQLLFTKFGIYKERLELKTIQTYSQNYTFKYVPVLDIGLSVEFENKSKIVSENNEYQRLLDNYSIFERTGGIQFLNSEKNVVLQEEMRELEKHIINNENMHQKVNASIEKYENAMIRNIYSFCKENTFNTAIFMCGAAHRKSIVEKIGEYDKNSELKLNWMFYKVTN